MLEISERPRPNISVVSALNEGTPNTIYQETTVGERTPLPFDYLSWDWDGAPMVGVTIVQLSESQSLLVQGGRVVGTVGIAAPHGATGHSVFTEELSVEANAPIFGIPTGRLRVFFRAGSVSGDYVLTFQLTDGNSTQRVVHVSQ